MDLQAILDDIDRQFATLNQVRALLAGLADNPALPAKQRGQPKGTNKKANTMVPDKRGKAARSPEAKARMAAAQQARWAAKKKAAADIPAAENSPGLTESIGKS